MRFNVPQFIEQEAKIVGPLTFKQFIYIGSAGIICLILFHIAPPVIFFSLAIILVTGSFCLAFIKINGKPLLTTIMNFFNFLISPKIFLWQKNKTKTQTQTKINIETFKKSSPSFKEELSKESQIKKIEMKIGIK
jgi:hypothetical protein